MKTFKYLLSSIVAITLVACSTKEVKEEKEIVPKTTTKIENGIATSTFKVWGNCEMCKETIESSLKADGISKADWNTESKIMTVSYDTAKIKLDKIQENIASVGYDNVAYKGDDKKYQSLHECCQYDRKKN